MASWKERLLQQAAEKIYHYEPPAAATGDDEDGLLGCQSQESGGQILTSLAGHCHFDDPEAGGATWRGSMISKEMK